MWFRISAFVAVLAWRSFAVAHPAPFSYLDVRIDQNAVDVTVVAHVFDVAHDLQIQNPDALLDPATLASHGAAVVSLLTGRIQIAADGSPLTGASWSDPEALPDRQSVRIRARFPIRQPPGVLSLTAWMFPYDPVHQTFINVYDRETLVLQTILSKDRSRVDHFPGTHQGTLAVVRKFALSGIHHILIGPDHLLFIVGLLLLGGSLRKLVLVVSAFTLAHSVTLSLAALDIVSPPASIVEPAIALSIVYVGIDNLMVRDGRDMRAWIAFAFGLIHGFGFAGCPAGDGFATAGAWLVAVLVQPRRRDWAGGCGPDGGVAAGRRAGAERAMGAAPGVCRISGGGRRRCVLVYRAGIFSGGLVSFPTYLPAGSPTTCLRHTRRHEDATTRRRPSRIGKQRPCRAPACGSLRPA